MQPENIKEKVSQGLLNNGILAEAQGPQVLTILPTYQCTAACKECCFESSRYVKGRIPQKKILSYIEEAVRSFPMMRLICFSGGECFLLGKDLDAAIGKVHSYGLLTRCVTNGYWAITEKNAAKRVSQLVNAGLTEINFSTGDEHQMFVPFSSVVNATIACAEAGLTTLIVVEQNQESKFTLKTALNDERLASFLEKSPAAKKFKIMANVWMPFHQDARITHGDEIYRQAIPCHNILNNIVITAHEQLAACCGLTMEYIPEMKLGNLSEHSMKELYFSQFDDFLKIWLSVDGPKAIYRFAVDKDSSIPYNEKISHICEACVLIHKDEKIRKVLSDHYEEKVPDVLFRFFFQRKLASKMTDLSQVLHEIQSGFGA